MLLTIIIWSLVGAAIFVLERRFRNNGQRLKKVLSDLERLLKEDDL